MKIIKQREIQITLTMNEDDARWLMGMLQNGDEYEDVQDSERRAEFFNKLKSVLSTGTI